ncbi:NXPE family member 2-like [Amphiura filiformis]|uniref:NXPE family member 2-like n=1 Tax=Amphiura filiformis TaxID=82378 RepID=UPI003B21612A
MFRVVSSTGAPALWFNNKLPNLQNSIPWRHWQISDDGNSLGETSSVNTRFQVLNSGPISKGDIVRIKIDARDKYNQTRFVGGDFWFAWLSSNKKPLASTAGKVIDYNNGTYIVIFLAAWAGNADISIILVHPSDATSFITDTWNTEKKVAWLAKYQNKTTTELTSCKLGSPGLWENMCIYPSPNANGRTSFMCDKPKGFPCSAITSHIADGKTIKASVTEIIKGKEFLFQGNNFQKKILGSGTTLKVRESSNELSLDAVPKCHTRMEIPLIKGYWLEGQWVSLSCRKFNCWNKTSLVAKCLQHKHVYFIGDSNARQYLNILLEMLGQPAAKITNVINVNLAALNITVHWQFQPEWISSGYAPFYNHEYVADMFDKFTNPTCDYVVVVSTWAHFTQWTRTAFLERLMLLRQAVKRFRARCPLAPVILKSPHPRTHPDLISRYYASDYLLNEMRKLIQKVFAMTDILFLDIWDMNMAYPAGNAIHMPTSCVEQELFVILSYVCDSMCEE